MRERHEVASKCVDCHSWSRVGNCSQRFEQEQHSRKRIKLIQHEQKLSWCGGWRDSGQERQRVQEAGKRLRTEHSTRSRASYASSTSHGPKSCNDEALAGPQARWRESSPKRGSARVQLRNPCSGPAAHAGSGRYAEVSHPDLTAFHIFRATLDGGVSIECCHTDDGDVNRASHVCKCT